jgi:hypothetical protein
MVNITGDGILQVVSEPVVIRISLVEGAIVRLAAEGVLDPEQHRRMDLEVVDVAGAEPGCGVVSVRRRAGRRRWVRRERRGSWCELLVVVSSGRPGHEWDAERCGRELDGDSDSSATSRTTVVAAVSRPDPTSGAPGVVDAADQQELACAVADRGERGG